jgi:hypothetical protein
MTILLIGSVLLGAVLGRFFKVLVLVPACAFVFVAILVRSAYVEHGLLPPPLEFAVLITSLQIGYVLGLFDEARSECVDEIFLMLLRRLPHETGRLMFRPGKLMRRRCSRPNRTSHGITSKDFAAAMPWKDLPGVKNRVEAEFLHLVLLGESVLPYRVFHPVEWLVPVTAKGKILNAEAAANRGSDGLHGWMRKAEPVWTDKR